MFQTVTATVLRPTRTIDRFGNEVDGPPVAEQVPGVLVAPGATSDMEAARPDGAKVALTLHFPKGYGARLQGCTVLLPEPWDREGGYRVVGDPLPHLAANVPGRWNRPVEVEAAHG